MNNTPPKLVINGHAASVIALVFSADGKTLVSGDCDQTAIIWDVESRMMRRRLRLINSTSSLGITPDGALVLTGDGEVWKANTGQRLRRSARFLDPLACSPNGKLLASSAFNLQDEGWGIVVSDIATGRKKQMFPCSCFQPITVAFSSDGSLVGATGLEQQDEETYVPVTTLCDLLTGQVRQTLRGCDLSLLMGISLLPHTRLIGLTSDGKQLWDVDSGQLLQMIETEELPYALGSIHTTGRTLSPCGRLMAVGWDQGYLAMYDVASSRILWQTQAHSGWLRTAAFTANSEVLATAGDDHVIQLWNATTGVSLCTLGRKGVTVEAVAFSADGIAITALGVNGTAWAWNLHSLHYERQEADTHNILRLGAPKYPDTARNLWQLSPSLLPNRMEHGSSPRIAAVSPDGSLVALYGFEPGVHSLHIWNIATQSVQCKMRDTYAPSNAMTFSSDNGWLALCTNPDAIRLYDTRSGDIWRELTIDQEHGWAQIELRFSLDGQALVSGDGAFAILLWDVKTGRMKRRMDAHGECVSALAFSPDGQTLAVSAAYSKSVWLKHLGRGGKQRFLRGHAGSIFTVSFSPEGTRIATGSQDGTVRLWEAESGKLLATFLALPERDWIIYTPEGHYNCSVGAEQYILWKIGDDLLPASAFSNTHHSLEKLPLAEGR